jgi:hypothetical protein
MATRRNGQPLPIHEHLLDAKHPQSADSLIDLAIDHIHRGDVRMAERFMGQAQRILGTQLGSNNPHTQRALQRLTALQHHLRIGRMLTISLLDYVAPQIALIAATIKQNSAPRQEAKRVLTRLEKESWKVRKPVERIWAGERDRAALIAGLDSMDAGFIERLLDMIE